MTNNRYNAGVASQADIAQADTLLKTTKAQAIDIGVLRAQLEHAVALLTGAPASSFSIPAGPLETSPRQSPSGCRPSFSNVGRTSRRRRGRSAAANAADRRRRGRVLPVPHLEAHRAAFRVRAGPSGLRGRAASGRSGHLWNGRYSTAA